MYRPIEIHLYWSHVKGPKENGKYQSAFMLFHLCPYTPMIETYMRAAGISVLHDCVT